MLIRFSLNNYKSFKQKNDLLLTTSTKIRTLPEHEKSVSSLKVLKFIGIYGDNASGKTNVLNAISFYKDLIAFNRVQRGLISFIDSDQETELEAVFSIGAKIYQYGFSFIKDKNSLTNGLLFSNEYLNVIGNETERSKIIFDYKEGINQNLLKADKLKQNISVYWDSFPKTNKDRLFLNYIVENLRGIEEENSSLKNVFDEVYGYIKNNIVTIGANTTNISYLTKSKIDLMKNYVKKFDPNIDDIVMSNVDKNELESFDLPPIVFNDISEALKNHSSNTVVLSSENKIFLFFSLDENNEIKIEKIQLKHKYIKSYFEFENESEGTRKFIILMSHFCSNYKNSVFVVDEIERSMHPLSSLYILEFFEKETKDYDTQFIFSTHNTDFMKKSLRKDEIYFVEKDVYGESMISPLTDFVTRGGSNIANMYLDGCFRKISPVGRKMFE